MSGGFISILMVLLTAVGGNELLDFVPTDAYWQRKGIAVTAEAMAGELAEAQPVGIPELIRDLGAEKHADRKAASAKLRLIGAPARPALERATKSDDPEVRERANELLANLSESGARGKAVRRLMAIRALGEMKAAGALPMLRGLLKSKEPFEADYAGRAVAAIEGQLYERPPLAKPGSDLRLLPTGCAVVAQMEIGAGGAAERKAAGILAPIPGAGLDLEALRDQVMELCIRTAERVGNIRIDRLTIGVAGDFDDDGAFIAVMARGLYDFKAVRALLKEEGVDQHRVDEMDFFSFDDEFAVIPYSDSHFALVISESDERRAPLREVLAALKHPAGAPRFDKEIAGLVAGADTTQPLWAVSRITKSYREVDILTPFDTVTLSTKRGKDSVLDCTLVARGKDMEAVKGAAETVEKGIRELLAEMNEQPGELRMMMGPLPEVMKTIEVKRQDATVTITGQMERSLLNPLLPMLMFMH